MQNIISSFDFHFNIGFGIDFGLDFAFRDFGLWQISYFDRSLSVQKSLAKHLDGLSAFSMLTLKKVCPPQSSNSAQLHIELALISA